MTTTRRRRVNRENKTTSRRADISEKKSRSIRPRPFMVKSASVQQISVFRRRHPLVRRPQNPRPSFLSRELCRLSRAVRRGGGRFASRRRSRETREIASDSPFWPCPLLCIGDSASAFEPRRSLQRESDVRGCLFRQIVSPALYQPPFPPYLSPPEAIYLICFSMPQTKEIKNSPFYELPARAENP